MIFKRKPKALYPTHGYSLGYLGTKREPLTWFRCKRCGARTLGSPYELPSRGFCWDYPQHQAEWEPMSRGDALATLREIEPEDIVQRVVRRS